MMFFLKKQKQKKAVKLVNEILTELEVIYLDDEQTFLKKEDINYYNLVDYTIEQLSKLSDTILSNEKYFCENHHDIIERAHRVEFVGLAVTKSLITEFEKAQSA